MVSMVSGAASACDVQRIRRLPDPWCRCWPTAVAADAHRRPQALPARRMRASRDRRDRCAGRRRCRAGCAASAGSLSADRLVPAADEQRRHRRHHRIQPGLDAPFDAAQVGLGGRDGTARAENSSVTLIGTPLKIDSSIAGTPSGVPGILTNRLARSPCRWMRAAASMLPAVSAASSGDSSIDTQPSTPSVASNTGRNRSAARRRSSSASSMNSASPDSPAARLVADARVVGSRCCRSPRRRWSGSRSGR